MLIIVTGLPGTGKTTFAMALANKLHVHHLNTDMIRDALGKRQQYDDQTKALIYREMRRHTYRYLAAGESVVVDGTFYRADVRAPFVDLTSELGIPLEWIELQAAEEVIKERVSKDRPYSEADFEVYQAIKSVFEPLPSPRLSLRSDIHPVDQLVDQAEDHLEQV